jgi:glycosyltransferase involved in cell wall biosynthesis
VTGPTAVTPPGPPRVTVCVATFNRAHLVGRAIRSALAQTFPHFELLVVDDGSSDGTPDAVRAFDDPRLRYVRHEQNRGISRTRNTAIAGATGEWVAFLDDDNEWLPDCLARQLALAASRPAADVVYCRPRLRDERTGRDVILRLVPDGPVFGHLVEGWHLLITCAMIRRRVLVEIGGLDERLGSTEDVDLWLRLARRSEFAGTSDVLVIRHDHHGGPQLSLDFRLRARDLAILDATWAPEITARCGRAAYRRWRLGLELWSALWAFGSGQRAEGWKATGRMAGWLPWSLPHLAGALVAALLGPRAYRRLAEVRLRLRTPAPVR